MPKKPTSPESINIAKLLKQDYSQVVLDTDYGKATMYEFSAIACSIKFENVEVFKKTWSGVIYYEKDRTHPKPEETDWKLGKSSPDKIYLASDASGGSQSDHRSVHAEKQVTEALQVAMLKAIREWYASGIEIILLVKEMQESINVADQDEAEIKYNLQENEKLIGHLKGQRLDILQSAVRLKQLVFDAMTETETETEEPAAAEVLEQPVPQEAK